MTEAFLTTDVLLHFLTGEDPAKQQRAKRLFEQIEQNEIKATVPLSVLADLIAILASPRYYNLPHAQIGTLLRPLLRLSGLRLRQRTMVVDALDLYSATHLDFTDALLWAELRQSKTAIVFSFDKDLDALGITRQEP